MAILSALAVALGVAVATGLKCFIGVFMAYIGLKFAIRIFGPLKLIEK